MQTLTRLAPAALATLSRLRERVLLAGYSAAAAAFGVFPVMRS
jgi:hypothetical protein